MQTSQAPANGRELKPAHPVLFTGIGPSAVSAIQRLNDAAADLHVNASGPFGLVTMARPDGKVRLDVYDWLSELAISTAFHDQGHGFSIEDKSLENEMARQLRRMCIDVPAVANDRSPRMRISAYMVVDLSMPGVVGSTLALARLLRKIEPLIDLTAVVLTGRTADSEHDTNQPWVESFSELLRHIQEEGSSSNGNGNTKPLVFHRLYLLDGCDANATWLQTPEEMEQLTADFLLHHSISPYRRHLRRQERSRVMPGEDFLHVTGSFSCRTLRSDRKEVARRVAKHLVDNDGVMLDQRPITDEQKKALDTEALELREMIKKIYLSSDAASEHDPAAQKHRETQIRDTIHSSLRRVCEKRQVAALRYFMSRFRPMLQQLSARSILVDRIMSRYRAAAAVCQQIDTTYDRLDQWQDYGDEVQWKDRLHPELPDAPPVPVCPPVNGRAFALGALIVMLGMAGFAFGSYKSAPNMVFCSVLGVIASFALLMYPWRWRLYRPPLLAHDQDIPPIVPDVEYREKASLKRLISATILITLGTVAIGFGTHLIEWIGGNSARWIFGVPLWIAAIGVARIVYRIKERNRRLKAKEDIDTQKLPGKWWLIGTLAWVSLGWWILQDGYGGAFNVGDARWSPWLLFAGSGVLGIGLLMIAWPVTGVKQLTHRMPPMPEPLEAGEATIIVAPEIEFNVDNMKSWVDHLLSNRPVESTLDWSPSQHSANILDALADKWDEHLAVTFRENVSKTLGVSFERLAEQPKNWADCIVDAKDDPTVSLDEPEYLFALHAVRSWLDKQSWQEVIGHLPLDPQWFDFFVTRVCAPRWPKPRTEPRTDASVVVVGGELWQIVSSLAEANSSHKLERVDWQEEQSIVIIRVVQGLPDGWLNLPELPQYRAAHTNIDRESYELNAAKIGKAREDMNLRFNNLTDRAQTISNNEWRKHAMDRTNACRWRVYDILDGLSPAKPTGIEPGIGESWTQMANLFDEIPAIGRLDMAHHQMLSCIDMLNKLVHALPQDELSTEIAKQILHTRTRIDQLLNETDPCGNGETTKAFEQAFTIMFDLLKDVARRLKQLSPVQRARLNAGIRAGHQVLIALANDLALHGQMTELENGESELIALTEAADELN